MRLKRTGILVFFALVGSGIFCNAHPDTSLWPKWVFKQPHKIIRAYSGDDVFSMMNNLKAGEKLIIHKGVYSRSPKFTLQIKGTQDDPVFIEGAAGESVTITRPDSNQNTINIDNTEYVSIRNIKVTGGSIGIRIYNANNLIIEDCEVYQTGAGAIAANSVDTSCLYFMHNHVHHTKEEGEAFYLGNHNDNGVMSNSVVYNNLIHDTGGSQGDGIEIKQGSFGNLVKDNVIYSTHYPGIITYGTNGKERNIIEGNVIMDSQENGIQIQGDAIVRNNIVLNSANFGFHSMDHTGTAENLALINNIFVNSGNASVSFRNFGNRQNMVLANNVIYNPNKQAISIGSGLTGGTIRGNVVLGSYPAGIIGVSTGTGIEKDFIDANGLNLYPKNEIFAGKGQVAGYNVAYDFLYEARGSAIYAGAFEKKGTQGYVITKDFKYPARDIPGCPYDTIQRVDDTPGAKQ